METVEKLIDYVPEMFMVASIIAAATPTPVDNVVLGVARQIINVMAGNVFNARPEKKPKLPARKG